MFDCDGVLVDSEPASLGSWRAAVARYGYQATLEEVGAFVGHTERHLADHFGEMLGVAAGEMEAAAKEEFLNLVATKALTAFSDTTGLLASLESATVPVAVGSNSFRWRLNAVLGSAGLAHRFDVSVAGDEVEAPKPAPWVYLRAAELLGVDPRRCVVIEDTPTGIAAARGAGAQVVAVDRGLFDPEKLAAADLVVVGGLHEQ